jgi:pyrroline-5-carboxylate reductase
MERRRIMSVQTVGFIGAGRVARILLSGWKNKQAMPSRVVLYDSDQKACEALKTLGPEIEGTAEPARAAAQDMVFLGVHPPVIKDAVEAIKQSLKSEAILVSLAPKFTIAKLSGMLGGFNRIVRMIPNAPSLIGRGYNPVVYAPSLSAEDKGGASSLFVPLGDCPEVEERHLEAYAILSAMGPTYFWPQLYALKSLGESFGLSGEAALEALDKMLWGAVATMKEPGLSSEQVQDLIPVKPMGEDVEALAAAYRSKLSALMEKIKP